MTSASASRLPDWPTARSQRRWDESSTHRRLLKSAVAGTASLAAAACGVNQRSASSAQIPAAVLREARPIGRGPRFHPPVDGHVVGRCRGSLGPRYGVHVEVFGANRVVIVPAGIGTRPPLRVSEGRISSAGCYGSVVTLEPTGVVLVRPAGTPTVADVFRAWGEPLSPRRIATFFAGARQRVRVFVDGRRWQGSPGRVPLTRHAEIVLEVGPYVPPHHSYTFPPGE